jgi:membrane-associated phospholipid phosphatase
MNSQLEWIRQLQEIRNPVLDSLISAMNFFDTPVFYFILIPLIWFGMGSKMGLRIFFIFTLSRILNVVLKVLFALPRPFDLDPSVAIIRVDGYGFPSGAAQAAVLMSGLLIFYWKNKWRWPSAIAYTALISFSRVYLGVHFPMDILGGWAAGFALLGIYFYLFPLIEALFAKFSTLKTFLITQALLLLILWMWPYFPFLTACGSTMGLTLGIYVNSAYKLRSQAAQSKREFFLQSAIGILGIFAIRGLFFLTLTPTLPAQFFEFFLYGLWISLLTIPLSKKIPLKR